MTRKPVMDSNREGRVLKTGCTWIVSAATSWHAPPPSVFKLWLCPLLVLVACEGIRGEVADLKARILAQEVKKWHPVEKAAWGKWKRLSTSVPLSSLLCYLWQSYSRNPGFLFVFRTIWHLTSTFLNVKRELTKRLVSVTLMSLPTVI